MPVVKSIINAVGHVLGKIVALSGIAAVSVALPYLVTVLGQPTPEGFWVVALVAGAVVWQKGVVPVISSLIQDAQPKNTSVQRAGTSVGDFLSLGDW